MTRWVIGWMDEEIERRTGGRTEGPVDDGRTDGQAVRHAHTDRYIPIIRNLVVYVVYLNIF